MFDEILYSFMWPLDSFSHSSIYKLVPVVVMAVIVLNSYSLLLPEFWYSLNNSVIFLMAGRLLFRLVIYCAHSNAEHTNSLGLPFRYW